MKATFTFFITIALAVFGLHCQAPPQQERQWVFELQTIDLPCQSSLRGLSVIDDQHFWISGSDGEAALVGIKDDGSISEYESLEGFDHKDFRDIHGWDNEEAIILSVGDSALFIRTTDRWKSHTTVYRDTTEGVFIDAMDFRGDFGVAFGDALHEKLYIVQSRDRGLSWNRLDKPDLPKPLRGEGGFAASGTNVNITENRVFIGTGAGPYPRLLSTDHDFSSWEISNVSLQRGSTGGVYGLDFKNDLEGVIVGGSFIDSLKIDSTVAYTQDGGRHWYYPSAGKEAPYRSGVSYSEVHDLYVSCGRTGISYSNNGIDWKVASTATGYYACQFGTDHLILVGRNGQCARLFISRS